MAVDGFARALALGAASAQDIANISSEVNQQIENVNQTLTDTKQEIQESVEQTLTESANQTNIALAGMQDKLNETTTEMQNKLDETNANLEALKAAFAEQRVKIFDSNIVAYEQMDPEVRKQFDIAIAAPGVSLTESQLQAINSIVGGAGVGIINMSEKELTSQLDSIIGGSE